VSLVHPAAAFSLPLPDGRTLALGERTLIMGVINVTPDSFSDGGQLLDPNARSMPACRWWPTAPTFSMWAASPRARRGAAGRARRTSPRASGDRRSVGARDRSDLDRHLQTAVADAALRAGRSIVNDISGLRYEPDLAGVVARHRAIVV
jgi:dihydropteroate synthase